MRRPHHRSVLGMLLRLGVTLAALAWVAAHVDLGETAELLRQAPGWAFWAPALLLLLNTVIHAVRARLLLSAAGVEVSLGVVWGAMLRAGFLALVLPTGGAEVAKLGFLGRATGRPDAALAALAAGRILEFLPWSGLLLFGLSQGLWAQDPVVGGAAAFFAAAFLGVVVLSLVGVGWGPAVARRLPGRLGVFAGRAAESLLQVRGRPGQVALALAWAVPFALINNLAIWVALRAHGVELPYIDVLSMFPAADTLISLPITINGVGVREGVFAHLLAGVGVDEPTAVAVALTRWLGELGRSAVGGGLYVLRPAPTAAR